MKVVEPETRSIGGNPGLDVRVEPFNDFHRAGIIGLLGSSFARTELLSWQYKGAGGADIEPCAAISSTGSIVGFNGVIPVDVQVSGERLPAAWSCDFVVDRQWRGRGVGSALKRRLQARTPMLMALGISHQAKAVHRALGWVELPGPATFTRQVRVVTAKQWLKYGLQQLQRLLRLRVLERAMDAVSRVDRLADVLPEADRLWARVGALYHNAVVRNRAYLEWRYAQHPLAEYSAISVRRNGEMVALGIWRMQDRNRCVLVDYLGDPTDVQSLRLIVAELLRQGKDATAVSCVTNAPTLINVLKDAGFSQWRTRPLGFSVHVSADCPNAAGQTWFLMGGDSDGDILDAGRAGAAFRVERWDEARFRVARTEWDDLLERSGADPLFLSWEWQFSWWQSFGAAEGLELHLLAVVDRESNLVAVAPLFKDTYTHRSMPSRRLQFIGNISRGHTTMRSEYLEFMLDPSHAETAANTLLDYIAADADWDEFVLSDLDDESVTSRCLAQHTYFDRCYRRVVDRFIGYVVPLQRGITEFKGALSSSARRRMFNLRGRLEKLGPVSLTYASHDEFQDFARQLDILHSLRWGEPFFGRRNWAFHKSLIDRLDRVGALQLSVMDVGGRPVSCLYNVRMLDREYNLQGGFDEQAYPGLPTGLLHLGYAIERAAADGVQSVELLIGGGKNRDYKSDFAEGTRKISALQMVRSKRLKAIYWSYDLVRGHQ